MSYNIHGNYFPRNYKYTNVFCSSLENIRMANPCNQWKISGIFPKRIKLLRLNAPPDKNKKSAPKFRALSYRIEREA